MWNIAYRTRLKERLAYAHNNLFSHFGIYSEIYISLNTVWQNMNYLLKINVHVYWSISSFLKCKWLFDVLAIKFQEFQQFLLNIFLHIWCFLLVYTNWASSGCCVQFTTVKKVEEGQIRVTIPHQMFYLGLVLQSLLYRNVKVIVCLLCGQVLKNTKTKSCRKSQAECHVKCPYFILSGKWFWTVYNMYFRN